VLSPQPLRVPNHLTPSSKLPPDEKLVPDPPRGIGRSIGRDLDVGKEGSE
jgi:hypothetical protein